MLLSVVSGAGLPPDPSGHSARQRGHALGISGCGRKEQGRLDRNEGKNYEGGTEQSKASNLCQQ